MKKSTQENLYRENPANGNIIIDIALDDYMDFFHEWDNAAFRKRDIHPELAEFLDICSEDIPIRKHLEIHFCVKNEALDAAKEKQIRASYHNFYQFLNRVESKKINRVFERALMLFLIALFLISVRVVLGSRLVGEIWPNVLLEGLLIGGWVFMWEALHMAFFESREPLRRNREIKRFLNAELVFKY